MQNKRLRERDDMSSKIVFGLTPSEKLARSIAKKIRCSYKTIKTSKFPDGEFHIRFPISVRNKELIIVQSFVDPNEKIVELLFIGNTAKELGARKVTLVAPYLAYMRSDRRFHKGEVVSSRVLARVLGSCVDEVLTIDPHLHRIKKLSEIFSIRAKKLTSVKLIATFIKKHYKRSIIIGPDEESFQWARAVAKELKTKAYVLKKKRIGSRAVVIKADDLKIKNQVVVIVDDIISTGNTMIETIKDAKKAKAKRIYCICIHGLFVENAYKRIKDAGAKEIVTTNTIPNKNSLIDVSSLIAGAIK